MNKIKMRLNIYGTECTPTSEDNETYVLAFGDEVEESIQSIMSKNNQASLTLAVIITTLSFCDNTKKTAVAANNLHSQIKGYLGDSPRNRLEADEAHREIERMKQEIRTLRTRLSAGKAARNPARELTCSVPAAPAQEKSVPLLGPRSLEKPEGPESPFEGEQPEESRPTTPAVPNVHADHYSHPASTQVPGGLNRSSFMSLSEKKETD